MLDMKRREFIALVGGADDRFSQRSVARRVRPHGGRVSPGPERNRLCRVLPKGLRARKLGQSGH